MGNEYKVKCSSITIKYKEEAGRIEVFDDVEIAFERNEGII
jgi:hypothetical protein